VVVLVVVMAACSTFSRLFPLGLFYGRLGLCETTVWQYD